MSARHVEYLIIGGGIAGVAAAEAIRSRDSGGSVVILSAEPHLLYSRVLLPSFLKGRIPRERLFLRAAEQMSEARIEIAAGAEVVSVDAANRRVLTAAGDFFSFDTLLIASGGRVRDWPYGSGERVYRLQTIEDADRMAADIGAGRIREPLIVGSSFIALEFIEIFLARGVMPRVLTPDPRFFAGMLEEKGGEMMAAHLARHGVAAFFNERIRTAEERDGVWEIQTESARVLSADALAAGIGLERNMSFLKDSGVELGKQGVKADEFLETGISGVFAAGDVAEYFDEISGRHRVSGNWTSAFLQGTRAGLNMAGERAAFGHVPSYAIQCAGLRIAALGECGPDAETAVRMDSALPRYERFFLRERRIAGAFLINGAQDLSHIAGLIAGKADMRPYEELLSDMAFDIRRIKQV